MVTETMERSALEDARAELQSAGVDPDAKYKTPAFMAEFAPGPDIERIAERLIARHRSRLGFLVDYDVRYWWKAKGGVARGNPVCGKCLKLTGLQKALADDADFVIWLAVDHVDALGFTNLQVEALVYHELLHADESIDDETGAATGPTVVGHDVEMFVAEIEQYGLWHPGLTRVGRAVQQLNLDL